MGMSMPSGGGGGRGKFSYRKPPMAEINITPFVDVMLVLLVIFMITAPMMTQGVDVSLPQVENAAINEADEPLQITLQSNGEIFLQGKSVLLEDLAPRLKAITYEKPKTMILVRADKNVPYGRVMKIMSHIQLSGLLNVGLVTVPPTGG
ncbi:MAG: protein TolR [Alphaproteobacteria bacterium]